MTTIDPAPWRDALAAIHDRQVTAVLAVQCDLGWLRPAAAVLRDEIDEALAALAMGRRRVRIDRILLHALPAIGDVPPEELAALNAAHADWLSGSPSWGSCCPRPPGHGSTGSSSAAANVAWG